MDYEALAKQFGGTAAQPASPTVDFDALARQFGAEVATPATPTQYASAVPQLDAQGNLIRQDNIPGPRREAPGVLDIIAGAPEAALALGSGAVASAVTPFAAIGEEIIQGRFGEGGPETSRRAAEMARALTYQPTTQTGQAITGTIGETLEGAGLEAIPFSQSLTAATLAPRAARQAASVVGREAGLVGEAIQSTPLARQAQEARVAQSYARAPQIEAANLAQQYGIALDPAVSNPTAATRAAVAAVGENELKQRLAAQNAPVWTRESKKAVGLPEKATLNEDAFKKLKEAPDVTEPYETVRKLPLIVADEAAINNLSDLMVEKLVGDVGGKGAAKVNKKISDIQAQLAEGISGDNLLKSVKDLRNQASSIYNKGKPTKPLKPGDVQLAELNMAAADLLESLIESNLSGKALSDYRAARAKYAQIYSLEAATNKVTGVVDPLKLARQLETGRPLSGPLADLATVASNFPDIATPGAAAAPLLPRFARASVGGTVGGIAGGLAGGPVGVPLGIAVGGAVSEIGRRVALNRMTRPGYQRSQAIPRDYRPEPLGFVPLQQQNWIYGEATPAAVSTEATPRNQLALPAPSYEATINALRAEEARRVRMGAMAESQAEQAQPPRAPTVGGVELQLDPITGRLRPTAAAPSTAVAPPPSIITAAQKLSRGQRFALTPEEMVAWNRTSVELAEILPELNKLSPKAIAEKMMDRKWVESSLKKAREKEAAFKEIEQRTRDMDMLRQARESRERLMDAVETLEDVLAAPRAKEGARAKGQGPKTRAARNQLREIDALNKLLD